MPSGSTGRPKAALLEHRGLVNLSQEQQRVFDIGPESRVLQFSSLSYDASTFEIMMALPKGATLYLGSREALLPGPNLLNFLRRHAITIVTLPPTALATLPVEPLPALQTITVAGEACPPELVDKWVSGRRFFNLYGPTETTIWATTAELQAADGSVHIGRPIANALTYILDPNQQPVPVGVPGELYIGGGVARGYHRRPDLTAERYIASPFRSGERLYKTGDRMRYRVDGNIEFLGRLDHQVKLRGFRIELGEIETVLEQHPAVSRAVAVLHKETSDGPNAARLAAYIVSNKNGAVAPTDDRSLQHDLVSHWRSLYDQTYRAAPASQDAAFNISGWNSSYTNDPLPASEMRQWLDHTIERIDAVRPDRVLEIGCGTGLVLFRVAPQCTRYVGTDFSSAALDYVADQVNRRDRNGSYADVTLAQCAATEATAVAAGETFDTVILNSVIQYFPSVEYLVEALEVAVKRIGLAGRIFIGDVRSLPLLRAFHTSVQAARESDDLTLAQLQRRVNQFMNQDQELVVDPTFFFTFERATPRVKRVEILPKRGHYDNELNRFRYDVILHIGEGQSTDVAQPTEPSPTSGWLDWQRAGFTLPQLEALLRDQAPSQLLLTGVPNARTLAHVLVAEALDQPERHVSIQELNREVGARLTELTPIGPESLWALADGMGYDLTISWAAARRDGSFEAAFTRKSEGLQQPTFPGPAHVPHDYTGTTNNPLYGRRLSRLVPELRQHVQRQLPEHMVPSALVLMDRLPVLPSGKLDRRALPPPETLRPELAVTYAEPRTPVEEKLTRVWEQVLNLKQVGIHDNFFELGGDSILSVQIVATARAANLQITTRDLFQHQKIAALATVAKPLRQAILTVPLAPAVGEVPLTAIQRWFFDQAQPAAHHFNQALLFDVAPPIDTEHLQLVLDELVSHHDALRLRFQHGESGWSQHVIERPSPTALQTFDLASIPAAQRPACIEAQSSRLQASLNLSEGPILRAALFKATDESYDRLLLVCHHLVVDGVSWRILLNDMAQGLAQLQAGQAIQLPPQSHSIRANATRLQEYAQTAQCAAAVTYWLNQPWDVVRPLPLDSTPRSDQNTVANSASISVALSRNATEKLLHEAPQAYGTQIDDALLAALARAFSLWTGHSWLHLDVEGHGRITPDDYLDLSRTVGWFTTIHPLLLHAGSSEEQTWAPGTALKSMKEQLRAVPNFGIDYGLARYLRWDRALKQQLHGHPQAQISFNYLGQFNSGWGAGKAFSRSDLIIGPSNSPQNRRQHLIEINGGVTDNRLRFTWTYNRECHRPETIRTVAHCFLEALEQIIEHCTATGSGGYTPSDFAALDVSQDELDEILAELSE